MIEPKEYIIKDNIKPNKLLLNGFKDHGDYYFTRKALYGNYVSLSLYVDKEDYSLGIKVQDNEGIPYVPFYNPDQRHNNLVYLEVIRNYTNFMDSLVTKGILDRVDEEKIKMNKDGKIIKIMYHTDIEKLKMTDNGDWCDLRVSEDTFIPQNEYKLVPLGVSMKLPERYEAHIVPRSSTFKNFGIIQTNSIGIIDNSYSGSNDVWKFPALCIEGKDTVNGKRGTLLHKNDRICQFRIMKKQKQLCFEEVDKLDDKDRGGFGSTGKN